MGIHYNKKQYFVRKMLQALSSTDGNRTSFKSSTVSLKTSSLNFDLLVAEICHKSLRNQKANELIKQLKKENGKTEDEIKLMKTNTLPSKIYVDPNWFKAFNNDDSSTKLKCKRFLKKGWKLGDGDTSKRQSIVSNTSRTSSTSKGWKRTSPSSNSNTKKKSTTASSNQKKKLEYKNRKIVKVEKPTRFSSRGNNQIKNSPNYKEQDSDEDDMMMEDDDTRDNNRQSNTKQKKLSVSFTKKENQEEEEEEDNDDNDDNEEDKESDEGNISDLSGDEDQSYA